MDSMGVNISAKTQFLFARPSFVEGVARVLDLGATLQIYNQSATAGEADARASVADWLAVGEDISAAIESYKQGIHAR